jgi:hypothetical protein
VIDKVLRAVGRLPTPVKLAGGAGLAYGLYRLLGRGHVDAKVDQGVLQAIHGVSPAKILVISSMVDEWKKDGRLNGDEMAALLAAAYKEGAFNLNAISPDGATDDKYGKAWGTFQFTADTLRGLGLSVEDVSPKKGPDGKVSSAELERAARGSARAALAFVFKQKPRWAGGRSYLEGVRAMTNRDPFKLAREVFTAWNAGVGRVWADIAKVAPSTTPGGLGYVHVTVSGKLKALPDFRKALGLPAIAITTTV